jgi:hypothetical protein
MSTAAQVRSGRVLPHPRYWGDTQEVVSILEDHLAEFVGGESDAFIFQVQSPLRRTKSRPRWQRACDEAAVSGLHVHDLRGSGATWEATTGAAEAELVARLGRTPTVAVRYQDAPQDRDIADKLGDLMWSANGESAGAPGVRAM